METSVLVAKATLLSLADGTTSLYLSTGGGIIGGGQHESVRKAATAFLAAGEAALPQMTPTTEYPQASGGHARFYLLTYSGTLTAEAAEMALISDEHPLHALAAAGQGVITQLRLVDGNIRREGATLG